MACTEQCSLRKLATDLAYPCFYDRGNNDCAILLLKRLHCFFYCYDNLKMLSVVHSVATALEYLEGSCPDSPTSIHPVRRPTLCLSLSLLQTAHAPAQTPPGAATAFPPSHRKENRNEATIGAAAQTHVPSLYNCGCFSFFVTVRQPGVL